MNTTSKVMHFRNQRARELELFARLLEKVNLGNPHQIYQVINELKDKAKGFHSPGTTDYLCWGYKINSLIFDIKDFPRRHIIPNINAMQLAIDIDLLCRWDYWGTLNDPLLKLNFKVQILGLDSNQSYSFGFHIDRNNNNGSEEIHPIYHLHYSPSVGGNTDIGKVLSLDAPRFMHAPIDIILGTDFVLSNFSPSIWDKLRNESEYISLCKIYQDNLWKPYVHTWASGWAYESTGICWPPPSSKSICPYLIN